MDLAAFQVQALPLLTFQAKVEFHSSWKSRFFATGNTVDCAWNQVSDVSTFEVWDGNAKLGILPAVLLRF